MNRLPIVFQRLEKRESLGQPFRQAHRDDRPPRISRMIHVHDPRDADQPGLDLDLD
jgi:hypothetical protein